MGKGGKGKTNRFLSTSFVPSASFLPFFSNSCHRKERIGGKGNFLLPPVNSLFSKSAPEKKEKREKNGKGRGEDTGILLPFLRFFKTAQELGMRKIPPLLFLLLFAFLLYFLSTGLL